MTLKLNKKEQALVDQLAVGKESEVVENRFGGESIELEPLAVAVYDYIMGCEAMRNDKGMMLGLSIFRKNWGEAYMVLLD
jgi:hypothetical protein